MKTFHAGKKAHVGRILFIELHREFDVEFDLLYFFVRKVFFTLLNDVWMVDFEMNKLLLTLQSYF